MVTDNAVAPTCTKTGLTEGKHCSACNEILVKQEIIPISPSAHNYNSAVTPPTATENGYTTYTCSHCGNTYTETIVPTDFTVSSSSGEKLGYTRFDENIVIPAVFENNGTWYRVTSIGYEAFATYYSNLKSIAIPDSVTSISIRAFYNCTNLTNIVIPASVTSIGYEAFRSCNKVTNVYITDIASWCAINFDSESNPLRYAKNLYLNNELVTELVIPEGTTRINNYAFMGSSITSITIPTSVEGIATYAFSGCYNVTSATIPANAIFCLPKDNLTTVVITGGTSIEYSAFSGCSNLTSITIPSSITSIGSSAFSGCTSLTNVYITDIASWCAISFASASSNPLYYAGGNLYLNNKLITELVIPDGVTSISSNAFKGCINVTNIIIPNSVTSIGEGAFSGCSGLESITIPFVGYTVTRTSGGQINTYTAPFGHIFGTNSYAGGVSTEQYQFTGYYKYDLDYYIPSGLKSVTITGGNITQGAFYGCSGLTSIAILDGVTSIGTEAFYNCSGLTSITIPNSVTSIDYCAFYGCSSLESMTLPIVGYRVPSNTSPYIKEYHPFGYFFGTGSYEGSVAVLQSYRDYRGDSQQYYYLPANLKSVTITGEYVMVYAFYNCTLLTNITLSNNVTRIDNHAFYGCTGLTSVTLPDSVTSIGVDAFRNCSNLTSITIPANLTYLGENAFDTQLLEKYTVDGYLGRILIHVPSDTIGSYTVKDGTMHIYASAFHNCSFLTSITIPNSVTYINGGAFSGCSSLNSITLPFVDSSFGYIFGRTSYTGSTSVNGYYIPTSLRTVTVTGTQEIPANAFKDCKHLTQIVLTNTVAIGDYAFENCTNLTKITISENCESIGYSAFNNCKGIRELVIPDSVSSFGSQPFSGMTGLTSVTLGSSVTTIRESMFHSLTNLQKVTFRGEVTKIESVAFYRCISLTSLTIPDSVTEIEGGAFMYCSSLLTVTIGDNVRIIGDAAFYGCSALNTITFGSKLNTIGANAFYGCSSLTGIALPDYVTTIGANAFYGCNGITTLKLSKNLLSIGESAFENCTKLTALSIPDTVDSLGNRAFYNCTNLNSIYFGKNLTSIGQYAFFGCTKLVSLAISDSVQTIGNYAFAKCSSLSGISIGEGITALGDYAFTGCNALTTVMFGSGIEEIGNYTFNECRSLANVILKGDVRSIGTGAFYKCSALSGISIQGVQFLGEEAFYECTKLTYALLGNKLTDIGSYTFYGCTALTYIEIPATVSSIGTNAFYNCICLENIVLNEGLTSIGENAFYNCGKVKSITIPDSVTNIGNQVFAFSGLKSIHLGSGITMIGTRTFYYCELLETVTGGDNVVTIADSAFYNCTSLKEFDLPASLMTIADNAFYNCTSLKQLILPEGLMTIGSNAFVNCSSVSEIYVPSTITYMTKGMFKGCGNVKTITLPYVGASGISIAPNESTLFGFIFGDVSYSGSVAVTQYYTSSASATYYVPAGLECIVITDATQVLYGAFSGLSQIKELSFSNKLQNIAANAISGTSSLELIYFRGTEAEWNSISKDANWDANSGEYALRFVPGNLVRVTVLDEFGNRMAFEATLQSASGNFLYTGIPTYYGCGFENVINGSYNLVVTSGSYTTTVAITVDGDEVIIIDSTKMDNIIDQFKDREVIVKLEWGLKPEDLDSHMTYTHDNEFYHVYFANTVDSNTGTNLDIDDRHSYGPEVITVLQLGDGIYRYSVYDYTHGSSTSSTSLANSGAVVSLYINANLVQTFYVPAGRGCLWTVFEYNGSTGELTVINTITGGMTSAQVR